MRWETEDLLLAAMLGALIGGAIVALNVERQLDRQRWRASEAELRAEIAESDARLARELRRPVAPKRGKRT